MFCPDCGIELDKNRKYCPLCYSKLVKSKQEIDVNLKSNIVSNLKEKKSISKGISNKLIWSVLTIFCVLSFTPLLIIFISYKSSHSWVFYPMLSIIFLWLSVTNLLYLNKKILLVCILEFILCNVFLFAIDSIEKTYNWYVNLAFPIGIIFLVLTFLFYIVLRISKRKGWNISAYLLFFLSVFIVSIEYIIDLSGNTYVNLCWSIYCISVFIPLALIFLYLHFALKQELKLRRYFHF